MPLIDSQTLCSQLSASVDQTQAAQLIAEFISIEKRYVLQDWGPAELDGGQFTEVLARILYHQDSGTLNHTKEVGHCLSYIEEEPNSHSLMPRKHALHLARVLRAVYKFRSDRGAVHVTPLFTANQMDARFISESVKWCFSEFLRLYWKGDREQVAKAIREISQFDVPSIARFGTKVLVQRIGLRVEEEILLLLHYAGEQGFTRRELGANAMQSAPSVTRAVQGLEAKREIIEMEANAYRLTDLGSKRVREQLAHLLTL